MNILCVLLLHSWPRFMFARTNYTWPELNSHLHRGDMTSCPSLPQVSQTQTTNNQPVHKYVWIAHCNTSVNLYIKLIAKTLESSLFTYRNTSNWTHQKQDARTTRGSSRGSKFYLESYAAFCGIKSWENIPAIDIVMLLLNTVNIGCNGLSDAHGADNDEHVVVRPSIRVVGGGPK